MTGEDITAHGTGNVGSMNVRRTTGSWGWFALAVLGDGLKGLIPTLVAKAWATGVPVFSLAAFKPWSQTLASVDAVWWQQPVLWVPMAAVAGAVLGHNYSIWMALIEHGFARTGKGLATGAGALLAYDWRYFVAVVVVGLAVIALEPLHDGRTGRSGRHAADRRRSCWAPPTGRSRSRWVPSSMRRTTSGSWGCWPARSRSSTSTTAADRAGDRV